MRTPERAVVVPTALAAVGALAVALSGVRGPDYPAHYLRAELWRRTGAAIWNFTWYGGHATPSYSVLAPPVVAAVGPVMICVVSATVATFVLALLIAEIAPEVGWVGRTLSAATFAAGSVVNVVVGRTNFAAGLAVGLLTLLLWRRGYLFTAVIAALVTPLVSPVVASFTALLAGAVLLDALLDRRDDEAIDAGAMLAASVVPLLVIGALFPDGGQFPFRFGHLVLALVLLGGTALTHRNRVVVIAAAMGAASSVVLFVLPNPLGGNFTRFAQYLVVPAIVLGAARQPAPWRHAAGAVALAGSIWTVQHGFVAEAQWSGDPSIKPAYHQPLIAELLRRNADGQPVGRVEIPFTDTHWEAYFVASEVPYARGWERQADLDRNEVLYDPELTPDDYRTWLHANGVRWVALPDVDLDEGGQPEAGLIEEGLPWLERVWSNRHWKLFEVVDYVPLVDPPAELVRQDVDTLVLFSEAAGVVTLRYRFSDQLTIDNGACLRPREDDEWTEVFLPAAGEYTVTVAAEALIPGTEPDACT